MCCQIYRIWYRFQSYNLIKTGSLPTSGLNQTQVRWWMDFISPLRQPRSDNLKTWYYSLIDPLSKWCTTLMLSMQARLGGAPLSAACLFQATDTISLLLLQQILSFYFIFIKAKDISNGNRKPERKLMNQKRDAIGRVWFFAYTSASNTSPHLFFICTSTPQQSFAGLILLWWYFSKGSHKSVITSKYKFSGTNTAPIRVPPHQTKPAGGAIIVQRPVWQAIGWGHITWLAMTLVIGV